MLWSLCSASSIWRSPAQHQLYSDASTFAWGGVLDNELIAHGLWTAEEKKHHITLLELIAVHRNLVALLPHYLASYSKPSAISLNAKCKMGP